ncbi:MAG TPA: alpha/beta hydrolase [Burkholderiaceae bacterium]|jgi:pimeloyl-ACP methyl ester carboxylesterase
MKSSITRSLLTALVLAAAPLAHAAAEPQEPFTVQVTGHGKPMILIPGMSSSAAVWDSTVAHYRENYQCYVLNLAGFAGVAPIEGPLLKQAEESLARFIEAKHLDHPVIVGHSLGGFLAMRLAADHPQQVGTLVIVDSLPALGATQMPNATPEQLQAMAAQVRDNMEHNEASHADEALRKMAQGMVSAPENVEKVVASSKASDRHTVNAAMYDILATDLRPELAKIKARTLVLGTWVAFKDYAPRSAIEATFQQQYAALAGVKIEMADSARHFIMYDDPNWMFQRIDAFLK